MFKLTLIVCLAVSALLAQSQAQVPPAARKASLQFSLQNLDRTADPCVDFYQFACGNWLKNNPIPPDQARWGRFDELEERNRDILHEILEEAAKPAASRDAITQKIGDYYAACMDEKAIDAQRPRAARAGAGAHSQFERQGGSWPAKSRTCSAIGVGALFEFSSGQDFKDSNMVIAQADQGGLGLPDRDYYLKDDREIGGAAAEIRGARGAHVRAGRRNAGAGQGRRRRRS